jgi:hypothetical protein
LLARPVLCRASVHDVDVAHSTTGCALLAADARTAQVLLSRRNSVAKITGGL